VLSSINQNTAYDSLVIDTLGLTAAEVQQLEAALAALQASRPVWLLK
jgi:hypothetical protein